MKNGERVRELQLRVVQVASGSAGGTCDKLATGFALSPSRILTCAHALVAGGQHQIRFLDVKREVWIPVTQVLFDGWEGGSKETGRDVAVLEVAAEEVKGVLPHEMRPVLSWRCPDSHERWWSRGVLHAAQERDDRGDPVSKIVGFRGTLDVPDQGETTRLEVNAPPKDATGWRGGSGSPVFIDEALVAIVSAWPTNWDGKVLEAAWLGGLRGDEAFAAAVTLSSTQERFLELLDRIRRLLDDDDAEGALIETVLLIETLLRAAKELEGKAAKEPEDRDASPNPKEVASWLLRLPPIEVVALVNRAYNEVMAPELIEKAEERPAIAKKLLRLGDLLLTAVLDRVTIDNLARRDGQFTLVQVQGSGRASLLALPCEARSVAELYMARLDGRPAEHQLEPELEDDPPGVLWVPFPPMTTQFKPETMNMVLEHLASACHLPRTRQTRGSLEKLAPRINKALATYANPRLSADPAKRWYLLFYEDALVEELLKLKEVLPELRICQLGGGMTEDAGDDEVELCVVLHQYFERKRRFYEYQELQARQGKGS